jgi:hypothetical protein
MCLGMIGRSCMCLRCLPDCDNRGHQASTHAAWGDQSLTWKYTLNFTHGCWLLRPDMNMHIKLHNILTFGGLSSVLMQLFEATHLMGAGFMIWNRNVDCFQRASRRTSFGTSPSCIYLWSMDQIKFSNPDDQLMPSLKKMM